MSCERALDDIVTEFMLKTCRLRPHTRKHAVLGAIICGQTATWPLFDVDSEAIPLVTGSVAEFYIEPMLPHVGDLDVMFYENTVLAILRGYPPPTQLPSEFHNYVKVFEIIDSHLPGYVYLKLRYLLTECSDDGNYNAVECEKGRYLGIPRYKYMYGSGPAACYTNPAAIQLQSLDVVHCVHCLMWPLQAVDWPTRHRNYGWPDSATLDHVVSNGCDIVRVAHRQCRQHKWMGQRQGRLSFSRAEIVLINSWLPTQQIVYHMLRYFIKTERLTDCADDSGAGTLSNYHIKTLMLWACELKPRNWCWWTDDVNLVRMCVQLLHILAEWLTYAQCQHYFISNCNLIDSSFNATNIGDQLMSVDQKWLSTWFVNNYVRKCSQLTPFYISRLFDDVSTSMKLQNAVSAVVAWRVNNTTFDFDFLREFFESECRIPHYINLFSLSPQSCFRWMTEIAKVDSRFSIYFTAVSFLHVACKSLKCGLNDELTYILATLCGHFICRRRYFNNFASRFSLNKAATLMKVVANKSLSTMSLIEIELSRSYLYRALRCKDSDSDSIYCLANVYLAVLYYTTGQYQTAIDHCTLVTRSQDHSQCSSHVVQGEILPKIDDDVDNMLGLAELYQSVRTAALKQKQQPYSVSVFMADLFAYYLHIKHLLVTKCRQVMQTSATDEFKRYAVCISDTQQLFIGDVLLFLSVSQLIKFRHKAVHPKPQHSLLNANKYSAPNLVELLQKSAVKHLTTFRQLEARDFGSVATIVTTDFEALYAYKCGDYQRCLQLSTQNVDTLLYGKNRLSVSTLPEFIQLADDDIVSLTALIVIVNPETRDFPYHSIISQTTLSLYLMTQCQLKQSPSMKSLVQTLDYVKVARREHPVKRIMDHLTLKLIKSKVLAYMNTLI